MQLMEFKQVNILQLYHPENRSASVTYGSATQSQSVVSNIENQYFKTK